MQRKQNAVSKKKDQKIGESIWAKELFNNGMQSLNSTIGGSPIPAFIIGKDHLVIYWNKALEELSGIKDIERTVITGVPHEEIVNFANKNKVDIVIIATHGRKGIDRLLFGSTAAQVVRFAPCPVLTVRLPNY